MDNLVCLNNTDPKFRPSVEKISGQNLNKCYQCAKCTAGCPIAGSVDFPPHKILRFIQLGLVKEALNAPTIWYCLSCITCTARCPNGVDLAKVMDTLRELALDVQGGKTAKPRIALFEELFLDSIRKHGRLYEMGTLLQYNLLSGRLFQDSELVMPLINKAKLEFRSKGIQGKKEIAHIFRKTNAEEG
ncbi:MAG: 4Fe-4S dicluster domain-containing protein [Candidatus Schekmanbacteria bacterium]|nr:4Fe-4S dicluster domain-containing protein [Candidatus Schekmanbacteria bacterium]